MTKSMRRIALIMGVMVIALSGCKTSVNEPENIRSDKERPSWSTPEDYDYGSSMTAIIQVDLTTQYPKAASDFAVTEKDLLAAFSGGQCIGVTGPKDGIFYLYILPTESMIELRYYSAQYKNIFKSTTVFPFQNDTRIGSLSAPFITNWVIE